MKNTAAKLTLLNTSLSLVLTITLNDNHDHIMFTKLLE